MKNAVLYLNILFCATFMLACEQDVEVFHASGEDRLNFYYEENAEADSLIDYTFIYLPSDKCLILFGLMWKLQAMLQIIHEL